MINKNKIKVNLVRVCGVGNFSTEYRITKLLNAVTVFGSSDNNGNTEFRVGDVVPEKTAKAFAQTYTTEVTK